MTPPDSYRANAGGGAERVNVYSQPVIIDLTDDNDKNNNTYDNDLLWRCWEHANWDDANWEHGNRQYVDWDYADWEHANFLRETDLNVPHPSEMRRRNKGVSYEEDTHNPPERKQMKRTHTSPYNSATVANDILRAAGIHPYLPPLNWHLVDRPW